MIWFALGAVVLLLAYLAIRGLTMRMLFADTHLAEIAARLPELKEQALAGEAERPASFITATLGVVYAVAPQDGTWLHHISVSCPVTPARAVGTFFLGLVRELLGLGAYPQEVFVSQNHVFHFIAQLSDEEHQAFRKLSIEPKDARELRTIAIAGRSALLPQLIEAVVPQHPSQSTAR